MFHKFCFIFPQFINSCKNRKLNNLNKWPARQISTLDWHTRKCTSLIRHWLILHIRQYIVTIHCTVTYDGLLFLVKSPWPTRWRGRGRCRLDSSIVAFIAFTEAVCGTPLSVTSHQCRINVILPFVTSSEYVWKERKIYKLIKL